MIGLKVGISRRFVPKFGYPGCWAFCNRRQTCRSACKPAILCEKPKFGSLAGMIGLKVGISRRFVPKFGYTGCWAFCNRRQTCRSACKPAILCRKAQSRVSGGHDRAESGYLEAFCAQIRVSGLLAVL